MTRRKLSPNAKMERTHALYRNEDGTVAEALCGRSVGGDRCAICDLQDEERALRGAIEDLVLAMSAGEDVLQPHAGPEVDLNGILTRYRVRRRGHGDGPEVDREGPGGDRRRGHGQRGGPR
jgi:hypothetical protein